MTRCCQNAYEPKWKELCELFDEDENLDIPVPDEEEEDDDADLLLDIPNMAAPPPNMTSRLLTFFILFAFMHRRARTTKMART
ncbi:UNVERIFIED_CONTAM: hypothetical protein Sindi_1436100 [Sesamum indicum]